MRKSVNIDKVEGGWLVFVCEDSEAVPVRRAVFTAVV